MYQWIILYGLFPRDNHQSLSYSYQYQPTIQVFLLGLEGFPSLFVEGFVPLFLGTFYHLQIIYHIFFASLLSAHLFWCIFQVCFPWLLTSHGFFETVSPCRDIFITPTEKSPTLLFYFILSNSSSMSFIIRSFSSRRASNSLLLLSISANIVRLSSGSRGIPCSLRYLTLSSILRNFSVSSSTKHLSYFSCVFFICSLIFSHNSVLFSISDSKSLIL
ncbi:hypothetical protein SWSSV_gp164 [White spot syndrome virus]|uniref:Wsv484 n=3 Tax=White spot syndrome virus TaxID=342409 RepID=Q8VAE1_WSSVS|nr:wsv484 [Shrimp white spot syndrome virus]YP_009220638.1 hypothetical protein SWSSV_gp164 [White spot syndrome virus]AAL33485.1 wsv484 [Shrimp white spot syndrome virus]AAL88879.1 WSSV011 [Shrimp white spot syndrome virus]AFX59858.1 wsv484 [White spot syndrome virus]ALN66282.1 hypothetical protein [White spot syndrome virus]ALN66607.1 hypothetical protein [White spot syndrome virus]